VSVDAAEVFEGQRPRLFGLAYRLLGSASDAEDAVQEAFLRWNSAETSTIEQPAAWLTRVVTNLCLTELTSARARRERYTGIWLPEPVLSADLGPLETVAQRESVSMALLLLCERLTPPERAVFILHEAFGYRYGEIAAIIDRGEAACRQLGHRAAERLKAASRPAPADPATARRLISQFLAAAAAGDVTGLEHLLAEDAVSIGDGGGKMPAGRYPVRGRAKVARLFAGFGPALTPGADRPPALANALGDAADGGLTVTSAEVNGASAILIWAGARLFGVFVPVIDGEAITELYGVVNPDKLAALNAGLSHDAGLSESTGLSKNTGLSHNTGL
jgi:RNA polymerase sigma-70 factor (ECF subfamily)